MDDEDCGTFCWSGDGLSCTDVVVEVRVGVSIVEGSRNSSSNEMYTE